jgi:hypothetical protein
MNLELDDDEFKEIESNFKKNNVITKETKNEFDKKEKNFIDTIIKNGKKEIKNLNINLKENIINDLKGQIVNTNCSTKLNETKLNTFFN